MQDFRKLKVWEESHQLALMIYRITESFPNNEQFGIISQVRRSSVSIPNNIAEGCGRNSDKDFIRFLHIALGSTHETLYLCILSRDLKFLSEENYILIEKQVEKIKAMLLSLMKVIKL